MLIDDLMRVGRELLEPVEQVERIGTGPREREVLAGTTVERRHAFAVDFRASGFVRSSREDRAYLRLEFGPVGLIESFEMQRRHERRPSSHCATPSTRRVTSSAGRDSVPWMGAASAASSLSLSRVSVGARAASAMTAFWSRAGSFIAGASGATMSSVALGAARRRWTTSVAAATSPSRFASARTRMLMMPKP